MRYTNKQNLGANTYIWNPWIGCTKISEACLNCYINSTCFIDIFYTFPRNFNFLPKGTIIHVGLQSDFFLEEADKYREAAWYEIRRHPNLVFLLITKRIDRIKDCLPEDWGEGWENVIIAATAETQKRADERIPLLLDIPCKHKWVACTPLLEEVELTKYLESGQIEHVEVLGEKSYNGEDVRPMKMQWVKSLKEQCVKNMVRLSFLYVGTNCILEDGSIISDDCSCYHSEIADSLDISYYQPLVFKLSKSTATY